MVVGITALAGAVTAGVARALGEQRRGGPAGLDDRGRRDLRWSPASRACCALSPDVAWSLLLVGSHVRRPGRAGPRDRRTRPAPDRPRAPGGDGLVGPRSPAGPARPGRRLAGRGRDRRRARHPSRHRRVGRGRAVVAIVSAADAAGHRDQPVDEIGARVPGRSSSVRHCCSRRAATATSPRGRCSVSAGWAAGPGSRPRCSASPRAPGSASLWAVAASRRGPARGGRRGHRARLALGVVGAPCRGRREPLRGRRAGLACSSPSASGSGSVHRREMTEFQPLFGRMFTAERVCRVVRQCEPDRIPGTSLRTEHQHDLERRLDAAGETEGAGACQQQRWVRVKAL